MFGDLAVDIKLLQEKEEIDFDKFLTLASRLTFVFDLLGTCTKFVVKTDFEGNIKKLREFNQKNKSSFKTLQMMLEHEKKLKLSNSSYSFDGTCSLIWLTRGMKYICTLIDKIIREKGINSFSTIAQNTYDEVLSPYHGMLTKAMVSKLFYFVPSYETVIDNLSKANPDEDLELNASLFVKQLNPLINKIYEYYTSNNLDKEFTA